MSTVQPCSINAQPGQRADPNLCLALIATSGTSPKLLQPWCLLLRRPSQAGTTTKVAGLDVCEPMTRPLRLRQPPSLRRARITRLFALFCRPPSLIISSLLEHRKTCSLGQAVQASGRGYSLPPDTCKGDRSHVMWDIDVRYALR